jgi:hypothetical protein
MHAVLARPAARALAACLLAGGVTTAAAAADFRGFVTDGPAGLLLFQTCQGASLSKQLLRVSDKSPDTALTAGVTAVRQVMQDRERPLYVEFAGDGNGGGVTVRRFHRAIGHIASCERAPKDIAPGTRLRAAGELDSWTFVADAAGARLRLAGGKPVRFPAAAFAPSREWTRTQVFDAWSPADGGTVRIEVTEEVCLHEGSETASGGRVTLRYVTSSVDGCAMRF